MMLKVTQAHIDKAYVDATASGKTLWAIHSDPIKVAMEEMGYKSISSCMGEVRSEGKLVGSLSEDAKNFREQFLYSCVRVNTKDDEKTIVGKYLAGTAGRKKTILARKIKVHPPPEPTTVEVYLHAESDHSVSQ